MRHHRLFGLGLSGALMLTIGLTYADPGDYPQCSKKATPNELESAKGAHKAATEFYERGDYDKAIQYWRDAYNLDCNAHPVLINIGNAYEKKGDKAAAILALETFMTRTGGTNTNIAARVTNLKAQLAAAPPPVAPPPITNVETRPPPVIAGEGERPYGITPWVLVAGGGAALLTGIILLPVGYGAISDADARCPNHDSCPFPDVVSSGNTGRLEVGIGWAALGVGAAAAGTGLVWQFVYNGKQAAKTGGGPSNVAVLPAVGPGLTGATLSGRF
jgi:hypothetical protein